MKFSVAILFVSSAYLEMKIRKYCWPGIQMIIAN
jgi:hypothetical protein